MTEHFKEYLPCQPFLVRTDNNPLTYIMMTPNLDAMGHQWVSALTWFNFKLEYQKGCDNTLVDALSWVPTWLDPDTVKSILDWVTLGTTCWAKVHDQQLEQEVCVPAGWTLVQMYVTDWAEAKTEDPMLSTVLDWLMAQKKTDLKTLLSEHAFSEEDQLILWNQQNFTIHQGALCLCSMPKGETEDLLLFMVPKAHWVTTLNGCYRDAGHQGHEHTLSLLQEHFWWPGMANQMQQSIKSCIHCLQHDSNLSKVPLHPIVATALMDLLHVDFTSIEMNLELNRLPKVTSVLVFQDHFTKHIMEYVIPHQTAKSVTKFLYQGYILIFGDPARVPSDWGANFTSSIIDEMHKLISMRKLQTTLYHPQTNGLVERSHQTIMQMIRKLGEDKKADWLGHLAEIVYAYNATWSTMMGHSPHYLMFGCRPRLPVDFYFPTFRSTEVPMRGTSAKHVEKYVATVCNQLRATLHEAQAQSMAKAQQQKQYYDQKIGAMDLKPGNLVLVKADTFQGKRKSKGSWEDKPFEVVHQIMTDVPLYKVMDSMWAVTCPIPQLTPPHHIRTGIPLCMGVCQAWDRLTSPTLVKPTPGSSGLVITQCQARKTSLGWINRMLWLLPWMSARASTEDGWRLQVMCSRSGCL